MNILNIFKTKKQREKESIEKQMKHAVEMLELCQFIFQGVSSTSKDISSENRYLYKMEANITPEAFTISTEKIKLNKEKEHTYVLGRNKDIIAEYHKNYVNKITEWTMIRNDVFKYAVWISEYNEIDNFKKLIISTLNDRLLNAGKPDLQLLLANPTLIER